MILARHAQSEFNAVFNLTREDPGIVGVRPDETEGFVQPSDLASGGEPPALEPVEQLGPKQARTASIRRPDLLEAPEQGSCARCHRSFLRGRMSARGRARGLAQDGAPP